MTLQKGANINTNTVATVSNEVEITGNVAVVAVADNPTRIKVVITITKFDAWVRFIPAATDNTIRKGILVEKDTQFTMPPREIYTGEISIINVKKWTKT